MKKYLALLTFYMLWSLPTSPVKAISISNVQTHTTSLKQYEKYEVKFNISTTAKHLLFQYDTNTPPGVTPGTGVTVQGIITTPSGKTLTHPAFYQHETRKIGSGSSMYFEETGNSYWTLRFAPQEIGTYQVTLRAIDNSGTSNLSVGTFNSTVGTKPGFIRVSRQDPKYFEFSNSQLYWPMGPAWPDNVGQTANPNAKNYDTSQFANTGMNFYRPWMAGYGAYSTNWARWPRNDKPHGNEGIESALTWDEKYPGSELSYELNSAIGATSYWLPRYGQDMFAFRLKNTCYKVSLTYKTTNLSGSVNFKPWSGWPSFKDSQSAMTSSLQNQPNIIGPITSSSNWQTITSNFMANSSFDNIFIYLSSGTSGKINIDHFSLREILPNKDCNQVTGSEQLGAEMVRNPKADLHTYVDDRGAAYFDWLLSEGEQYGVYYKLVVHDKNDWVQNHIDPTTGQWTQATLSWPYYASDFTKNRWLLQQWYRYVVARWGYSTAVHSWELNNEGPPELTQHWSTTQSFAQYMKSIDAHPHLASTSFWCCWRPSFWGNTSLYPDVGYADLHDYSGNSETSGFNYADDVVGGMIKINSVVNNSNINKPTIIGEQGLSRMPEWWNPATDSWLNTPNDGTWWRQLQWATAFHPGAVSSPGYWFPSHLKQFNREQISTVLKNYLLGVEWNKGGYIDAQINSSARAVGKKNLNTGVANLWVQNNGAQTNVTISIKPSTAYYIELWDTRNGTITKQYKSSDSSGNITVTTLAIPDTAIKLIPENYTPQPIPNTPIPTNQPTPTKPDPNGDGITNVNDLIYLFRNYNQQYSPVNQDLNADSIINLIDMIIVQKALN